MIRLGALLTLFYAYIAYATYADTPFVEHEGTQYIVAQNRQQFLQEVLGLRRLLLIPFPPFFCVLENDNPYSFVKQNLVNEAESEHGGNYIRHPVLPSVSYFLTSTATMGLSILMHFQTAMIWNWAWMCALQLNFEIGFGGLALRSHNNAVWRDWNKKSWRAELLRRDAYFYHDADCLSRCAVQKQV